MEFNQDNRAFSTPLTVLDTVAEQLADVDLTLPDYCPDIEKILKCTLIPKIQSKTLSGGQLQVDGFCMVNVLYVESEGKTIRCCEQSISFSQSFTVRDSGESPVVLTKTKPEYINCRALSPRRLVMHGAFSLSAKVIVSSRTELFTPEDESLEVLWESVPLSDLKSNCQEQFTVSEEISVADKPIIESVLYSKVSACVTDVKAASGKLMLTGAISLRMFYLTNLETGETAKFDYLLPFVQMIDCDGISEETENIIGCEVMSYDIRLKNDILSDKPAISFDAMLCVTAQGYVTAEESIAVDAYSTEYASAPQFAALKYIGGVCPFGDSFIEKLTAKIDSGSISKVLDIYADRVSVDVACADGGLTVKGKINLCILALDGDSFPTLVERSLDYEKTLDSCEGCNLIFFDSLSVPSISYRLTEDNSVEIRCEVKICGGAVNSETLKAVNGVEIFEDRPTPPSDCALILYYASGGENLWDVAKAHNTRLEMLKSENALEENLLEGDKMLFIPKL